jgi:DNA uptake protein ComE-like DNA-binding protein
MQPSLWKTYFRFSRIERPAILILLLLTAAFFITPVLTERLMPVIVAKDSAFLNAVRVFEGELAAAARQRNFDKHTVTRSSRKQQGIKRSRITPVNINTADSALWEALPGIGPVLAARIVRFRDKLGGFYAISQVAETYGLPDSTFNKIQPYLLLGKVSLKKLDINGMDEKSLAQHPYIRYKLARIIVRYRSNNGPFSVTNDLLGIPLVDDSIYRKIEHYIKTENSPL